MYGGASICWSGDFGAWRRSKSKGKLGAIEKIKKSLVGGVKAHKFRC